MLNLVRAKQIQT